MRLIQGGKQQSIAHVLGEGALLTLAAAVLAFVVGFGFWAGIYLLERLIG